MSKQYKLQADPEGDPTSVNIVGTNISIPFAEGNTDYQEYVAWLAEGNEPLPADEPPADD